MTDDCGAGLLSSWGRFATCLGEEWQVTNLPHQRRQVSNLPHVPEPINCGWTSLMSSRRLFLLAAGVVCLVALVTSRPGLTQPKAPPPPAKYDIEIHYRIVAFRNERARQFLALKKELKALGFERDDKDEELGDDLNEIENVKVTRMKGTIPSANARKV